MKKYLLNCVERLRENGHYLIEATDRADVCEEIVGVWDKRHKVENFPAMCAKQIFLRKNGPLPVELIDQVMSFITY